MLFLIVYQHINLQAYSWQGASVRRLISQLSCFSWCCDCHYSDTFRASVEHINAALITDTVTLPIYKPHCTSQLILCGHLCLWINPLPKITYPLIKFVVLSVCIMPYTSLSKCIPHRFRSHHFHYIIKKTWTSYLRFGLNFSFLSSPAACLEYQVSDLPANPKQLNSTLGSFLLKGMISDCLLW